MSNSDIVAALEETTISYPQWKAKVAAGLYNPKDGSTTHWGVALKMLQPFGPNSINPAPPVGPFVKQGAAAWFRNINSPTTISKILVEGAPDYGIGIMSYWPPVLPPVPVAPWVLEDCLGLGIGPDPSDAPGTACAGMWIGAKTNANRNIGDGTWMGWWTGCTAGGSLIQNFISAKQDANGNYTLQTPGTGVYCEHVSNGITFDTGIVYSAGHGFNFEWWYTSSTYGAYVQSLLGQTWAGAGKSGSWGNTLRNLSIYCPAGSVGVFEDAGTFSNTYDYIYFWGPGDAIGLPNNRLGPLSTVNSTCVFANEGASVYYHNNAIGLQPGRKLHPHTLRMEDKWRA